MNDLINARQKTNENEMNFTLKSNKSYLSEFHYYWCEREIMHINAIGREINDLLILFQLQN